METMKAWVARERGRIALQQKRIPQPAADEVLVAVSACGVCRTDLHVIDRELPVHRRNVTPGHQVIGTIEKIGKRVRWLSPGQQVGIAWLRRTCGTCAWCTNGRENLCPASQYNGWDHDGGFAEYMTVPESFAYALPPGTDPLQFAPLLCAGIIGYRALARAVLPAGGRLGIYGFGSSAHITAQLARSFGAEIVAITRGHDNQVLAREMGASFVGEERAKPPQPLDAAIVFAPAGDLVPLALEATTRGGTVVLAGIHMSDIPPMAYESHLFYERDLRTVTANTRADGHAFLRVAHAIRLEPQVSSYAFDDADAAISDLRQGRSSGSSVISVR